MRGSSGGGVLVAPERRVRLPGRVLDERLLVLRELGVRTVLLDRRGADDGAALHRAVVLGGGDHVAVADLGHRGAREDRHVGERTDALRAGSRRTAVERPAGELGDGAGTVHVRVGAAGREPRVEALDRAAHADRALGRDVAAVAEVHRDGVVGLAGLDPDGHPRGLALARRELCDRAVGLAAVLGLTDPEALGGGARDERDGVPRGLRDRVRGLLHPRHVRESAVVERRVGAEDELDLAARERRHGQAGEAWHGASGADGRVARVGDEAVVEGSPPGVLEVAGDPAEAALHGAPHEVVAGVVAARRERVQHLDVRVGVGVERLDERLDDGERAIESADVAPLTRGNARRAGATSCAGPSRRGRGRGGPRPAPWRAPPRSRGRRGACRPGSSRASRASGRPRRSCRARAPRGADRPAGPGSSPSRRRSSSGRRSGR